MCAELWQGILGLAEAGDVHSGDKDIRLGSYEERPCGLESGTLKLSHGAERAMGSGSQGHTASLGRWETGHGPRREDGD